MNENKERNTTNKIWTAKEVERILLIAQDVLSLDMPVSNEEGEGTILADVIPDDSPSPEDNLLIDDRKKLLETYITKYLTPREKEIITMRYGLDSGEPMTLAEIGDKIHLTRERVRQLEERIVRKLRYRFVRDKIKWEDL